MAVVVEANRDFHNLKDKPYPPPEEARKMASEMARGMGFDPDVKAKE